MAWVARPCKTWTAAVVAAAQPLALVLTAAAQVSVTSGCQLAPSGQLLPDCMCLMAPAGLLLHASCQVLCI